MLPSPHTRLHLSMYNPPPSLIAVIKSLVPLSVDISKDKEEKSASFLHPAVWLTEPPSCIKLTGWLQEPTTKKAYPPPLIVHHKNRKNETGGKSGSLQVVQPVLASGYASRLWGPVAQRMEVASDGPTATFLCECTDLCLQRVGPLLLGAERLL